MLLLQQTPQWTPGTTALSVIFRRREIRISDAITIEEINIIRGILKGGLRYWSNMQETTSCGIFILSIYIIILLLSIVLKCWLSFSLLSQTQFFKKKKKQKRYMDCLELFEC